MKKPVVIIAVIVVAAALAGGGYAVFHKPSKPAATTAKTVQTTSPGVHTDAANVVKSDTPAVTNTLITTHSFASLGQYLADPSGNALYTYSKDTSTTSACTGSCLAAWPIYQDTGATTGLPTDMGTITRTDNGQNQYTYKGKPLYYFASDSPNQVTGDSLNNFHVAKP